MIGPLVADGAIVLGEIDGADSLPRGWTERQDAGRYRLEPTGTAEVFAFATPSSSWKRYVYPERALLISSRRDGDRVTVHEPPVDPPPMAFFGMRSCDLAALGVLDRVLADPAATDPWYRSIREDAFVVAAACGTPGGTCFCGSMGTGPAPTAGFDLALTELPGPGADDPDSGELRYLVEVGTDRGEETLGRLASESATADDIAAAAAIVDRAIAGMGRSLDPADPPLAAADPEARRWADVADRCLACANCTIVCPTCFCGTTEDVTDLTGGEAQRFRVWDSCFGLDFSRLHGGSVRTTTASRYRHWLLHKLVTWHDQFGSSGCVGCGRCVTWCPVGIDLTEEVAALADERRAASSSGSLR